LKKEGRTIEKMCPNGSYRQAGAVNSPPDSGGAALGVVRLFGTLNQKYI
jgi:hypothetical protein